MPENRYTKGIVKIGVVAYAPKVVTIWEGMKNYIHSQGFNADSIFHSNYPALVEALVAGQVDIACPGARRGRRRRAEQSDLGCVYGC
jgi:ABC-type phosphate/phosphonate transport system substrate-binding protein